MIKIYAASRASIPERGIMWRELRTQGAGIVSSWIDGEVSDYSQLWVNITKEIEMADRLVLYVEPEDFPLKGAFIEAGIALGLGKPIYIVAPNVEIDKVNFRPLGSWTTHPLVQFSTNITDAVFKE